MAVLEENGREADTGRHRGDDDPGAPARRPQHRDERERERRDDDEAVERGDVGRVERGLNGGRVAQAVPGAAETVVGPCLERHGQGGRADGERRDPPPPPVGEERGHEREPARRGEGAGRGGRLQERPGIHDGPHGRCCRKHGAEREPVSQRPSLEERPAPRGAACRAEGRRAPPRRR